MSTSIHVKISGAWKDVASYHVKVSGTWKEGSEIHAKVSSAWEGGSTGAGGGSGSNVLTLDVPNFVMPTIGILPAKSGITTTNLDFLNFVMPTVGDD